MGEELGARAYCSNCHGMVEFETRTEKKRIVHDGVPIEYEARAAYCVNCGDELAYEPYEEEGAQAFAEALRIHNGIVPLSIIKALPKKYHIGKRPLSLLLGWGEVTYSRYIEGHIPSIGYSNIIQRLFDNPVEYEQLLEKNRGLISDRAYQNSKKAVKALIESDQPETEKMLEVASEFCVLSGGNIGAREIEKLTYYAQAFSLVVLDEPLFELEPEAWVAGPVYRRLWEIFKLDNVSGVYGDGRLSLKDSSCFDEKEEDLIKAVWHAFGIYGGTVLSEMTHREDPWLLARKRAGVGVDERCSEPIRLGDMRSFFEKRLDGKRGIRDMAKKYAEESAGEVLLSIMGMQPS